MHREILAPRQVELLPLLKKFSREFYLVGGTAIALYIGHRRSIDFDLFTSKKLKRKSIQSIIEKSKFPVQGVLYEDYEQLHIVVNSVKMTFFNFTNKIDSPVDFEGIIKMPTLFDLSAMKAFALGGRAKWKDYVDLYFLLRDHFSLKGVSARAKDVFKNFFNEKMFREQLSYFKDIDYTETVEYMDKDFKEEVIKEYLIEAATASF